MEDKILNRVKKMLAIAECSGATEAERDTALKMAYKVLAAHNLSMVDLDAHVNQEQDPRAMHDNEGYSMIWAKHIYNDIAGLFFCKYFGGRKVNAYKCVHHFVGRQSNATTAMHMAQFIVDSLVKECRKVYGHALVPEARAFALGASSKLRERIAIIKKQQQEESESTATGTALVLVNLYESEKDANALTIAELGIKLSKGAKGKSSVNSDAYGAGKEYGAKISLAPQVGGNKSSTKKIGT